ncbi:hypothetical protein N0M98_22495 [Paenibacillus doosanensis]|uniref:efflux RND transporter periplasmic adaptor subunit n=1 Tax=Paenibacillus doosanensis TaxID=1229154 RepID=UPI00217F6645|nr:hypothetical protein [Paenibacillus doosanensis]MCS7462899.1 hypothetical protein [Paenibacillus doosanensis]
MEEPNSLVRKRNIRLLAGLFVALLVALTLGGNTIRALSMPKVITTAPTAGSLDYSYEGTAIVRPAGEQDLTNPAGWKVLNVLVKVGDAVYKSQPLVQYDDSDAQDELAELQSALQKLQLSLPQLQYNVITAMKGEDEEAKLSAASALETTQLDIADQQRRIEKQQKKLAAGRELTAPVDGIVTAVGAVEGSDPSGKPDIRLSDSSKGFRIKLTVPNELASRFRAGDTLKSIFLEDSGKQPLAGTVAAIEEGVGSAGDDAGANAASGVKTAPSSLLTVSLHADDVPLQGGEQVKVSIRKSEGESLLLVPKEAVHYDSKGAFVYTISSEAGPLGNAYYAKLTRIETAGSNEYATAVKAGLFEQDEVIAANTGLLTSGTRVRY